MPAKLACQNAASMDAITALIADTSMSSAPIHHPARSELKNAKASALPKLESLLISARGVFAAELERLAEARMLGAR